jgi:hypothetical protein
MAGVTHRHMTGRIEYSLVCQDATGRREIFEDFTFHCAVRTW